MKSRWSKLGSIVTVGMLLAGCRPGVATPEPAAAATATVAAESTAEPTGETAAAAGTAAGAAGEQGRDEVMATIPVGNYAGAHVVFNAGTAWVTNAADGTMSHIDTSTNQVVDTLTVGEKGGKYGSPIAAAMAAGSLWVTDNAGSAILRLDPATGEVQAAIPLESV